MLCAPLHVVRARNFHSIFRFRLTRKLALNIVVARAESSARIEPLRRVSFATVRDTSTETVVKHTGVHYGEGYEESSEEAGQEGGEEAREEEGREEVVTRRPALARAPAHSPCMHTGARFCRAFP